MTSLWSFDEPSPKPGYIWRTRNAKGDPRVQTDILGGGVALDGSSTGNRTGGAYCVTTKHTPFVGPRDKGMAIDPRTGEKRKLHPKVEKALTRAIDLQMIMHKALGQELHSIGWDVMVREDEPLFIEFNINNGFFVGDHSLEELELMTAFYGREYQARLPKQLLNFDPEEEEAKKKK